ncbi:TetR-like C-terminal domain-containing protein [Kitasatospora paranensis]|uniref:TetR-like C-terminal domain-containing protein n=1 Tax=Kitasatospora paranensis TaxID=258053 RepID=UPI0031EB1DF6
MGHAVRDWALRNPHEYALIFGSPVPGYAAPEDTVTPGIRVPFLLGSLFMPGAPGDAQPQDGTGAAPAPPAAAVPRRPAERFGRCSTGCPTACRPSWSSAA